MMVPDFACAPCERSTKRTSHPVPMMNVTTAISAHYTHSVTGRNQLGLESVTKAGGSGARRPQPRGNGSCRHCTQPTLQPRRRKGQPGADPGQFLGRFRSVEIQARAGRHQRVRLARSAPYLGELACAGRNSAARTARAWQLEVRRDSEEVCAPVERTPGGLRGSTVRLEGCR
jgi:hypothetical protein